MSRKPTEDVMENTPTAKLFDRKSEQVHGTDKVARYDWKVKDKKGEFQYVSKHYLQIDHANYQRERLTRPKILQIAADWSWVACGALVIARRPTGDLFVMDGQYRLNAAMRRSDIQDLPCLIFDVHNITTEAKGFLDVNTLRKQMQYLDRFKAEVTGGNEAAVFVRAMIENSGRTIGKNPTEVRCVGALMDWVIKDRDALMRVWPTLDQLSKNEYLPVQIVEALMFIETNMPDDESLAEPRHLRRFLQIGQNELLKSARSAAQFRGKGGAKVWADGIINRYNKALRTTKLELRPGALTF